MRKQTSKTGIDNWKKFSGEVGDFLGRMESQSKREWNVARAVARAETLLKLLSESSVQRR